MLVAVCSSCVLVIRVLGELDELETLVGSRSSFWPDRYTCPRCEKTCRVMLEHEAVREKLLNADTVELTPGEFFRALQGLGLPDEIQCGRKEVETLLRTKKIKRIAGHEVTKNTRFCLEWIEFEDGTKAYFGASSHGAVVYKITNPPNYTGKILEKNDAQG